MIQSYEDLEVYQRSYKKALEIHKLSQELPQEERYELGSQIRRAATSIPINIAEGYGKKESTQEFKRFITIARGSCDETKVLVDLIKDLGYISQEKHEEIKEEYKTIGKMLYKLHNAWKQY